MVKIQIGHNGNFANKMFQYMYCSELNRLVPGSRIEGFSMPYWGLESPKSHLEGRVLNIDAGHIHDPRSIAYKLKHGIYNNVYFNAYVQRLEYLREPAAYQMMFRPAIEVVPPKISARELLLNVRGAEVLTNVHPDYGPLPVCFYERIVNITGLDPVLCGQLGPDPYSAELRKTFSGCRILPHVSPITDFQTIRHAQNVVISVSTFSWLAAWLSEKATKIHVPLKGFLNPEQRPDIDLIPFLDSRYSFYHFPVEKWHATPEQLDRLRSDKFDLREIRAGAIQALIT